MEVLVISHHVAVNLHKVTAPYFVLIYIVQQYEDCTVLQIYWAVQPCSPEQ